MSDNSRTGAFSRGPKTVLAAVFIIAMMLAVPVMVAPQSDAAITEGEAGYSVKMVNPTDSELTKFSVSKADDIAASADFVMSIFDMEPYSEGGPTVTATSYTTSWAQGIELGSDYAKQIEASCVKAEGVTMTYTAIGNGNLLNDEYFYADDFKAIVQAVRVYFGDEVNIGDVLKVTGKVSSETSKKTRVNLATVSDGVYVNKDSEHVRYLLADTDVTIEFTHNGNTKSITATADFKLMLERNATFDYHGAAYSSLTDTSPCTVKFDPDRYSETSGDVTFKVSGENYSAEYLLLPPHDQETTADLRSETDINALLTDARNVAAAIPAGTDNVTVGREYSDAESAYNEVAADVLKDDLMKIILIVLGVVFGLILLIVVVIVVIVVMRNKKKRANA